MQQIPIYFKSDFKLFIRTEAGFAVPFKFEFYTNMPSRPYIVKFDGHKYHNCELLEDGRLCIAFDAHGFGLGKLMIRQSYYLNDADYASEICDRVIAPQPVVNIDDNLLRSEIVLALSGDDTIEFTSQLPPYYQAGLTHEEHQALIDATVHAEEAAASANEQAGIATEAAKAADEARQALTTAYNEKVAALDADYAQKKSALEADYSGVKDALSSDYASVKAQLDADYAATKEALTTDYTTALAGLNDRMTAIESQFSADREAWNKSVADFITASQATFDGKLTDWQSQVDAAIADITRLQEKDVEQDQKLSELESKVGTISSVKEATSGIAYTNTINIDLKQGDIVDVYWEGDNIASNLAVLDSSNATLATLTKGVKQTITIQNPTTYLSLEKKGSLVTDGIATFYIEGGLIKEVEIIEGKVIAQQQDIENIKKENDITLDNWVSGYFANKNTGANSKAKGLFDVTNFVVIPLGVTSVSVRTAIQGNAGICFYDKEQTFISAVSGTDVKLTDRVVDVPSNAVYLKISLLLSAGSRDDVKLSVIGFATILQNISQETRKASNAVVGDGGVEINPNRNIGFIDASGNKQSTPTTYFYTDVIELSKGQGILVTSADPSGTEVARISTWDSTGNTFYKVCALGTTTETTARYVATEDKEYIRVSGYSSNPMTIMFLENAIPNILADNESYIKSIVKDSINEFEEFDFLPFQTIGVIGDSLASGCSNYYDESAGKMVGLDRPAFSWGAFLGRETGIDVKLFTKGGASTKTWLSSDWGLAKAQQSENKCECYIIGLGVNDYSKSGLDYVGTAADVHVGNESANADSFYGNYSRIIAALKAIQPRCKIFMFNLPNTPNNKINATTTAYRSAIKEISTLYDSVYLLDLFEDKWYESKEINATYYGAHYTAIGYKAMAMHIKKILNKFIKDNIDEFTDVQWITEPY